MSFFQRFLSDDESEKLTKDSLCKLCIKDLDNIGYCSSICLEKCSSICSTVVSSISPPHQEDNLKRFLIIAASSIITTLFLLTLLVICFKFYLRRRRTIAITRRWSMEEARNWEGDGPSPVIIDHPIWHIRTIGLNPSVISSIKVCKYSKKDSVVEGTDCSVCLSEFEEDETLRLLPKCRHAFHLPCIDTWLRSHTNCPLCRAPIVVIDEVVEESSSSVIVQEEDGEVERDLEEERDEFVSNVIRDVGDHMEVDDDDSRKRVRRSVSLDSVAGLRVSEIVFGSRGKEKVKRSGNIGSSMRSSFLKRSISYSGK